MITTCYKIQYPYDEKVFHIKKELTLGDTIVSLVWNDIEKASEPFSVTKGKNEMYLTMTRKFMKDSCDFYGDIPSMMILLRIIKFFELAHVFYNKHPKERFTLCKDKEYTDLKLDFGKNGSLEKILNELKGGDEFLCFTAISASILNPNLTYRDKQQPIEELAMEMYNIHRNWRISNKLGAVSTLIDFYVKENYSLAKIQEMFKYP